MGAEEETWVVEVRRVPASGREPGGWHRVSECGDGNTAIAVADALQSLIGLYPDRGTFMTRLRMVSSGNAD